MLPVSLLFALSTPLQNAPQTDVITMQNQVDCMPQAVPFSAATRFIYSMFLSEEETRALGLKDAVAKAKQWTEFELNGAKVGFADSVDSVEFSGRSNPVRVAWGMRYWGEKLKQYSWIDKADTMVSLVLQYPRIQGSVPGGFSIKSRSWQPEASAENSVEIAWSLKDYADSFPSFSLASTARSASQAILANNKKALSNPSTDPLFELNRQNRTGGSSSALAQACAVLQKRMVRSTTVWQRDVSIIGSVKDESTGAQAAIASGLLRAGQKQDNPGIFQDGVWVMRAVSGMMKMQPLILQGFTASTANAECRATLPYQKYQGFVASEGMIAAAYAEADAFFGGFYTSHAGWSVGIDGVNSVNGKPLNVLVTNAIPYRGKFEIDWVKANGTRESIPDPARPKMFTRMLIQSTPEQDFIVAEPASSTNDGAFPSGSFVLADGRKLPAAIGAHGLQAKISAADLALGPVSFVSSWNTIRPTNLLITPDFRPTVWGSRGWMNRSQLAGDPVVSANAEGWISPSIASSASRNFARKVVSAEFTLRGKELTFQIQGGNGRVELVDAVNAVKYNSTVQTSRLPESFVKWPISKGYGRRVYIRIIDENKSDGMFMARGFRLK